MAKFLVALALFIGVQANARPLEVSGVTVKCMFDISKSTQSLLETTKQHINKYDMQIISSNYKYLFIEVKSAYALYTQTFSTEEKKKTLLAKFERVALAKANRLKNDLEISEDRISWWGCEFNYPQTNVDADEKKKILSGEKHIPLSIDKK